MKCDSNECPGGPGKISWFNDGTTASGISAATNPGIAVYDQATLGGYWLMHLPNGRQAVFKQIDIGPAPWTGRLYDFSTPALSAIGYTTGNFPTDATAIGTYLGKTVPPQYAGLVIGQGGSANTATAPTSSSTSLPAAGAATPAAAATTGLLGCLVPVLAVCAITVASVRAMK